MAGLATDEALIQRLLSAGIESIKGLRAHEIV
jgi:hypothetical protein